MIAVILSLFLPSGHNSLCESLSKSSRIWTCSWHLPLRKQGQPWLAYWEQPALCDGDRMICWGLENNIVKKGTTQVSFNETLPSRQYIPPRFSSRLLGSSTLKKLKKSKPLSECHGNVHNKESHGKHKHWWRQRTHIKFLLPPLKTPLSPL